MSFGYFIGYIIFIVLGITCLMNGVVFALKGYGAIEALITFLFSILFFYLAHTIKKKNKENKINSGNQKQTNNDNENTQKFTQKNALTSNPSDSENLAKTSEGEIKTPKQPEPSKHKKQKKITVCKMCGHVYEPGETYCPDCCAIETIDQ